MGKIFCIDCKERIVVEGDWDWLTTIFNKDSKEKEKGRTYVEYEDNRYRCARCVLEQRKLIDADRKYRAEQIKVPVQVPQKTVARPTETTFILPSQEYVP